MFIIGIIIFGLFVALAIIMSAVHLNHIREDIRKITILIENYLYDAEEK